MTEANGSILYLTRADYEALHHALAEWAKAKGEPIPPFSLAKSDDIDALVKVPAHRFFETDQYPTLGEKAAIIFYTINKRQIFLNGNKRMSTLSLIVFLGINGCNLTVSPDALRDKALWLANTASLEFPAIKQELTEWIKTHLHPRESGR